MERTDTLIVGAGPGGCSTALKLNKQGMSCILVDKSDFPRDKICGDAISGKVLTVLNRIDPEIIKRFNTEWNPQDIWGIRLVAPNTVSLDVPFKFSYKKGEEPAPGYVSKRVDFDNFLIDEVKRCELVDLRLGVETGEIEKTDDGFIVQVKDGEPIFCKLLIMANGAQSAFSRKYAGIPKEPAHYAGAVRAYYSNVTGFHEDGFIELHFIKEYIPGYFWAFPLPDGGANVGLGLRTDFISKKKLNLKASLEDIIQNHPIISQRFKDSKLESKIVGYPLPLGSKKYPISGDNFMLVGDAGHLIDPLTGEGIGNAIYSGWIAAEQAEICFKNADFSAKTMKAYDVRIARVLGAEMRLSYQLQRLLAYPWLLNMFAKRLNQSKNLMNILSKMYLDFELRKQLVNPVFWFKVLIKKT
jgi:geranylgeranyl reductase family protein